MAAGVVPAQLLLVVVLVLLAGMSVAVGVGVTTTGAVLDVGNMAVNSSDALRFFDVAIPDGRRIGIKLDPRSLRVLEIGMSDDLQAAGTLSLVKPGDQLVAVNGHYVAMKSVAEVSSLVQAAATPRILRFSTTRQSLGSVSDVADQEAFPNPARSLPHGDFEVSLDAAQPLGLNISRMLHVVDISGQAAAAPIFVGDRIIAVNSVSTLHLDAAAAFSLLEEACRRPRTVQCRGGDSGAVYCAVTEDPLPSRSCVLRFRPGPAGPWNLEQRKALKVQGISEPHHAPARTWFVSATDTLLLYKDAKATIRSVSTRPAGFGGAFSCRELPIKAASPLDACSSLVNAKELGGAIVLIRRGQCFFEIKARFAQEAGAAAIIVFNAQPNDEMLTMMAADGGTDITASVAMVSFSDGSELLQTVRRAGASHDVNTGLARSVMAAFSNNDDCIPPSIGGVVVAPPRKREDSWKDAYVDSAEAADLFMKVIMSRMAAESEQNADQET